MYNNMKPLFVWIFLLLSTELVFGAKPTPLTNQCLKAIHSMSSSVSVPTVFEFSRGSNIGKDLRIFKFGFPEKLVGGLPTQFFYTYREPLGGVDVRIYFYNGSKVARPFRTAIQFDACVDIDGDKEPNFIEGRSAELLLPGDFNGGSVEKFVLKTTFAYVGDSSSWPIRSELTHPIRKC